MKGITYIITGKGKGKTTQALGLALRAAGWGQKVLFIQFCKPSDLKTGEKKAVENIPSIDIIQFGDCDLWGKGNPSFPKGDEAKKEAKKALNYAKEKSAKYDLVILDEVFYALDDGLINKDDLIQFIKKKEEDLNIVLTGRNAPKAVIELSDITSKIEVIKYEQENKNVKGIDY